VWGGVEINKFKKKFKNTKVIIRLDSFIGLNLRNLNAQKKGSSPAFVFDKLKQVCRVINMGYDTNYYYIGAIMNKKSAILATYLIMFSTSSVLPTTFQQKIDDAVVQATKEKNNAVIEAMYAADKAGELAQFAQDRYIQILERKNEELQAKKGKQHKQSSALFEHSWDPIGTNGLDLDAHGLKIVEYTADDLDLAAKGLKVFGWAAFAYMMRLVFDDFFTSIANAPVRIVDMDKRRADFNMQFFKAMLSGTAGCLSMLGRQQVRRMQRDRIIDALIEKNQAIIAQLQEIQQKA
jgi:hypothetical protein